MGFFLRLRRSSMARVYETDPPFPLGRFYETARRLPPANSRMADTTPGRLEHGMEQPRPRSFSARMVSTVKNSLSSRTGLMRTPPPCAPGQYLPDLSGHAVQHVYGQ